MAAVLVDSAQGDAVSLGICVQQKLVDQNHLKRFPIGARRFCRDPFQRRRHFFKLVPAPSGSLGRFRSDVGGVAFREPYRALRHKLDGAVSGKTLRVRAEDLAADGVHTLWASLTIWPHPLSMTLR